MFTLKHLIAAFLAYVKISVNAGTTSPKTLRWYEDLVKPLAPLHDRPAETLRAHDLVDIKITHGRARVIKCLFAWAAEQDLIRKDYFKKGLKKPRCGRRKRILERREMSALMRTSSRQLRRFIFVMYETMARPGEIRELTWGQINWSTRCIKLKEFKGKDRRGDGLEERDFAMPASVARLLANMHRKSPDRSSTGRVFYAPRGKPWSENGLRTAMLRACERAGLRTGEKVSAYHLRHTAATNAIQEGENIVHVGKQMGHASTKTTERYCHLQNSDIVQAIDRISARPRTRKTRLRLATSQAG